MITQWTDIPAREALLNDRSERQSPLALLWRHPRWTGFIAFNVVVVAAFFGFRGFALTMSHAGPGGIPNVILGYAGMTFLAVAWAIAWGAWAARQTNLWLRKRGT